MDISSTTRSLLSSPMSAEGAKAQSVAYQNLGKGVSDLGEGLGKAVPVIGQKVAAVLQHWQQTKIEATDSDSQVQLHQLHDAALDTFQKNIAGQPESVIQQEYARLQESTSKGFAALKFSDAARAEGATYHARRLHEATLLGARTGYAQFAEQGKANATTLYQSLVQKRDFADAERVLSGAVQAGFLYKENARQIAQRAHTDIQRQDMDTFIANNPFGAREVIADIRKTGQNPHFGLLTPEEIANSDIRAQTSIRDLQRRTSDEIDTAILSGQARDEATIRDLAAPARLPEAELKSHIASLREVPVNTPAEKANYLQAQSEIATIVAGYDPQEDPGDTYYLSLKRMVRQYLPMSERASVLQQLNDRQTKGFTMADRLRADTYRQIDLMAKSGVLGVYQGSQGENDPDRMMRVFSNVQMLKRDLVAFQKSKPEATSGDINKWLIDRITNQVVLRGARRVRDQNRGSSPRQPNANTLGGR